MQKLRKQLKYRNRSTLAGNIYTYWYVISKFDDAIFIIHVTGETHVLHKKVFFDERHGGSQEERHKQVDVDGVARAVELSTTDSMVLLISSFLSDMGTANYYIVVLLGLQFIFRVQNIIFNFHFNLLEVDHNDDGYD